jgi:predicted heme/steroid binding protein
MMGRLLIGTVLVALVSVALVYYNPSLVDIGLKLLKSKGTPSNDDGSPSESISSNSKKNGASTEAVKTLEADPSCVENNDKLFSPQILAFFDGSPGSPGLYLAFLGVVYDVSKGAKHYGPGGGYSFFAGKDASRAFITGEFNEDGLVDDVQGLEVSSFGGIREWSQFYEKDYKRIGRVVGTYYDSRGCPTSRVQYLEDMYRLLDEQDKAQDEENHRFPPCNSQWTHETNVTRVWCSTLSGGIQRDWVGVPRELFQPKTKSYRCACVRATGPPSVPAIVYAEDDEEEDGKGGVSEETRPQPDGIRGDLDNPRLREYKDCDPESYECNLQ